MTSTQEVVSTTITGTDGSITSATAVCTPSSVYNPPTSGPITNLPSSSGSDMSERSSVMSAKTSVSDSWRTPFPTFSYEHTTSIRRSRRNTQHTESSSYQSATSTSRRWGTYRPHRTWTAGATVVTITAFPTTCPKRTRSQTIFTTDILTYYSGTCAVSPTQSHRSSAPRATRTNIVIIREYPTTCPVRTRVHTVLTTDIRTLCPEVCPTSG